MTERKPRNSEICDKIGCYSRYFCGEPDAACCPIAVIAAMRFDKDRVVIIEEIERAEKKVSER